MEQPLKKRNTAPLDLVSKLPLELVQIVKSFLDFDSVSSCFLVCKSWNSAFLSAVVRLRYKPEIQIGSIQLSKYLNLQTFCFQGQIGKKELNELKCAKLQHLEVQINFPLVTTLPFLTTLNSLSVECIDKNEQNIPLLQESISELRLKTLSLNGSTYRQNFGLRTLYYNTDKLQLKECRTLENLFFQRCYIDAHELKSLSLLTKLSHLVLKYCRIENSLQDFENFTSLRSLSLIKLTESPSAEKHIKLPLNLQTCIMTYANPVLNSSSPLMYLKHLEVAQLNDITLKSLPNVESLRLIPDQRSAVFIKYRCMTMLTKLTSLDLSHPLHKKFTQVFANMEIFTRLIQLRRLLLCNFGDPNTKHLDLLPLSLNTLIIDGCVEISHLDQLTQLTRLSHSNLDLELPSMIYQ
jgi:hypothetical protein